MSEPVPSWKFWHPIPFWQVLVVFLIASLVANLTLVALREGLGLALPQWIGGGVGGVLGVLAVQALVRKRRAQSP